MMARRRRSFRHAIIGPIAFGRMWRQPGGDGSHPARRPHEFLLAPGIGRRVGPPTSTGAADHRYDHDEDDFGAHHFLQGVTERVDDQQQQRQLRQRRNRSVSHISAHAARHPGDGADVVPTTTAISIAVSRRDRSAAAVEQPCEQVLTETSRRRDVATTEGRPALKSIALIGTLHSHSPTPRGG